MFLYDTINFLFNFNVFIMQQPSEILNTIILNGSAEIFLSTLRNKNILNINNADYSTLVELSKKPRAVEKDFQDFGKIIERLPVINQKIPLKITHEFDSDGSNPYFILKIYQKLSKENIHVETTSTEKTKAFLNFYESHKRTKSTKTTMLSDIPSIRFLATIQAGRFTFEEVSVIIEEDYKKTLNAEKKSKSFSMLNPFTFTLFGLGFLFFATRENSSQNESSLRKLFDA